MIKVDKHTTSGELVVKANVESSIGGRSEGLTSLSGNVLRTTVVIAQRILDLFQKRES